MTTMNPVLLDRFVDLPSSMAPQAAPGTWECALKQLPAAGYVLNGGAGRGGLSWILANSGYSVESVDLHPSHFLAEGLECRYADLTEPLPYKAETFDAVLAVEVIEHLENPWAFMREAIRTLRPNGLLIVTTPNVNSLPSRLEFLISGILPYFRQESFEGCYHVTPIFPWAVARWCSTVAATLDAVTYSRVDWPTRRDIPKQYGKRGYKRLLKDLLPLDSLTGEIACFRIRKHGVQSVSIGIHGR